MERDLSRLAELVDVVLPQIKDEEFDLTVYKCGTVACAVGHACFHPPFQEAGLALSYYDVGYTPYPMVQGSTGVMFQGSTGVGAVMKFFNLTEEEVDRLFFPHTYPDQVKTTKGEVMQRIRELLATNCSSES